MDSVLIVLFSKNNYNTDCVTGPRPHAGIRILLKPQTFFLYESASRPLASPQTSFGVRLSRIHFSPTVRGGEHEPSEPCTLACVATVSARVRRESWDERKKKEWRERGRGEKEVTSSSLPFPVPCFFFFAPALTRLETLATQATCTSKPHICETALQGGFFFIRRVWRIHVDIFFLSDGFGEFMWIFFYPTGLANSCRTTS